MLKNHPRGLVIVFFTEMWERFGFYVLMAILVLYMDQDLGWDDARKGDFYGWFLASVYFIPIAGGWLGDRILGYRRTITLGAVLLAFGYVSLALSSREQIAFFYAGLILVAVGTGVFKANMSTTVGNLYEDGSPLKDAGFNIYYMGVNVGAALAPLAATFLHRLIGTYNAAFAAAAAGMVLALSIFQGGRSRIPDQAPAGAAIGGQARGAEIRGEEREGRQRIATLFTLFVIVIFFWVAFYQNGFALTLFADRSTVRSELLRPETYPFFNPFFILALTPPLVGWFAALGKRGREPSSATKIFIGMVICAVSMLVMFAASLAGGDTDVNIMSPLWLIGSYFAITLGEILVSPMGLSFVSKVAPRNVRGLMMGCWFGATAVGSYGAGFLGKSYSAVPHHTFFLIIALMLFFSGGLVLLFLKRLNRFAG